MACILHHCSPYLLSFGFHFWLDLFLHFHSFLQFWLHRLLLCLKHLIHRHTYSCADSMPNMTFCSCFLLISIWRLSASCSALYCRSRSSFSAASRLTFFSASANLQRWSVESDHSSNWVTVSESLLPSQPTDRFRIFFSVLPVLYWLPEAPLPLPDASKITRCRPQKLDLELSSSQV